MKILFMLFIIVLFSQFRNDTNFNNSNQKQKKTLYFGDSVKYYLNKKINLYPYDDDRQGVIYKNKSNFYLYLISSGFNYNLYLFYDASFSDEIFSNSIYEYECNDTLKIPILTDFDINFDSKYGDINHKGKVVVRLIHDKPLVFDSQGKIISRW
jgi:hypothetical protein